LTVQVKRGEIIIAGFGTKEAAHLRMHVTLSVWKHACREQTRLTNSNPIELINVYLFLYSCVCFEFGICPGLVNYGRLNTRAPRPHLAVVGLKVEEVGEGELRVGALVGHRPVERQTLREALDPGGPTARGDTLCRLWSTILQDTEGADS